MKQVIKICQVFVLAFILLVSVSKITNARRIVRNSDTETTTEHIELSCQENVPCGWAVYTPFTRKVDYFMRNTCKCPMNLTCLKTDDDLSVSAYVYRCRLLNNSNNSDTNSGDTS